jgi:hypothetical protein
MFNCIHLGKYAENDSKLSFIVAIVAHSCIFTLLAKPMAFKRPAGRPVPPHLPGSAGLAG